MLSKELCYLSDYGQELLITLQQQGMDVDLAFEVLNLIVADDELFDLEVPRGDF